MIMFVEGYNLSLMLLDYVVMKYVIIGFIVGLGKQLVNKGIRVNLVVLGLIWMLLQILGGQCGENILKFGKEILVVLLNCVGQLVEFVGIYVFLVLEEFSYVIF